MTPEERIAKLETRQEGTDAWLKEIDAKLDQLIAAANMGRGAWWALLKIGGLLLLLVGAAAWIWERWPKR